MAALQYLNTALLMMFMSAFMQIAPLMKMIMNLCKQDRLDAWGVYLHQTY